MECQFIERGAEQLYSVYHEPKLSANNDTGVVLCYPLGQEYIRCHKLYVNLANKLACQGFHVLRFDYLGTGDSSGDFSLVSINSCLEDISVAVNELKEVCRLSKISLTGIRFGATLALLYSQQNMIHKLVLWDPILSGTEYLKEISKDYKEWLSGSFTKEKKKGKNSVISFGFLFSQSLTSEIKTITLSKHDYNIKSPILLIGSTEVSEIKEVGNVTFEKSVSKEFWIKREAERDKSMVPVYELNKILNWF